MRIKSVTRITLPEAVPVYDLTVPGTENFQLASGPFVHNSKDGADAMVGVYTMLMKTPSSWKPELRADNDPRPIKDRLSDREKELIGEYIDKDAPKGSLIEKIKKNAGSHVRVRRNLRRRSLRDKS